MIEWSVQVSLKEKILLVFRWFRKTDTYGLIK